MRRLSMCMGTILALLILVSSGAGQDWVPTTSNRWLPRFLQFKRVPEQKATPAPQASATAAPASPIPPVTMINPKSAEALRQLEHDKLARRQLVCDALKQIAQQTGDEDLRRKAEYLDGRAFKTYCTRTGCVLPYPPGSGYALPTVESAPVAANTEGSIIDEYLRSSKARQNPDFSGANSEQRFRANVEELP